MDFAGPEAADYQNVRSLNGAFLRLLRHRTDGAQLREGLPETLRAEVRSMSDDALDRLAEAPYLLMSFRERDAARWQALLEDRPNLDLFAAGAAGSPVERLISTGLGFLWLLARRNPFAARLLSGATLEWCERLAEATLVALVDAATAHPELLTLRAAGRYPVWPALLGNGLSDDPRLRRAAQLSVLQAMLTSGATRRYRMRAAACSASVPALTISDRSDRR